MTYEVYNYIFIGGAILSAVMFLLSIILFFALRIPSVIGDLSGANAKKAIENIRNQNENTGNKTYQSSAVNKARGRLTDKISPSGSLQKAASGRLHGAMATEKISTQKLMPKNDAANETTLLYELEPTNETTVLSENTNANETTVLSAGMLLGETTVLNEGNSSDETVKLSEESFSSEFVIEYELTMIHSEELIA